MASETVSEGLVIRIKGAEYFVASGAGEIRCTLRGKLRLAQAPEDVLPVVGDRIRFVLGRSREARGPRGSIASILPRRSLLARTDPAQKLGYRVMGANMDRAILVFAAAQPSLNARMLDRMIVAAERGSLESVICVNKTDLAADRASLERSMQPYRAMGYRLIFSSARTGEGMDELAGLLRTGLSLLAGPSGTGKTSIIARIEPGLELAIGHISEKTGKGRHTTTHFELHRLECGGYLGDTPGVREFGIWGVAKSDLASFFRDFAPYRGACRFATCTHSHEPQCAVKEAVEEGAVSSDRYDSYLRILSSLPGR